MSTTSSRPTAHPAARVPGQQAGDSDQAREPTLGALVHDLSEQIPALIRSEIHLAQAEVTEKGKSLGAGIGMVGGAGYLVHLAALAAVAAAVLGIAETFAPWLAALIVAAGLLVVAGLVALVGRRRIQEGTPPVPARAIEGAREDIETLKGAHP